MDWFNRAIVILLAVLVLTWLAALTLALVEHLTDRAPPEPLDPPRPRLYHPHDDPA